MTTNIGDIPVQYIEEFSPDKTTRGSNVFKGMFRRPTTRAGSDEPHALTLKGTAIGDGVKTEHEMIEDLTALKRDPGYNHISLANRVGYLDIKDIDSQCLAEKANMREYTLSGYFQPSAQYEPSIRIETEAYTDEWDKGIVSIIPLPVGATNVRVKSPWGSVPISASGTITGADGVIPVYQPFPVLDWRTYGCALAGATPAAATFDATAYSGKKILLTHYADETITWSFIVGKDIPACKYKIGFRVEDGASAGAFTVTVTGSVSGAILSAESHTTAASAGAWEQFQTAELSLLTNETITVVVAKATNDNAFSINYGYLIPQNTCRLTFSAANEYNAGECKVYDTVTSGNTVVATWKRIYNDEHVFSGDIVVQNSLLRWTIKQATAWSSATTLTELISNTTGTLYPIAFGTDLTDIIVDQILPNCIILKARMDVGAAATYDSLNDVETAEITITPTAFYFDLTRIGSFRYDWHCSLASALYGKGSAFVDATGTAGVQSNPYYMLGVAGAVLGMQKTTLDNTNVGGTVLDTASTAVSESGDYAFSVFMVPIPLSYNGTGFTLSTDTGTPWHDDTTVDWTTRYATVTGTAIAHAAPGYNLVANTDSSYRFRSYKWADVSGNIVKVTLPASCNAGDYIYVKFAAQDGALSDGYGVGVIRQATDVWNVCTVKGTTVTDTTVAVTNLNDGDIAFIKWDKTAAGFTHYVRENGGAYPAGTTVADTTYTWGYLGFVAHSASGSKTFVLKDVAIPTSGILGYTNVPSGGGFAPQLRGAMMGRALIGGVDTPCTYFGDDFNWDTSAEYYGSGSWDTTNGMVTISSTDQCIFSKVKMGYGSYVFKVRHHIGVTATTNGIVFGKSSDSVTYTGEVTARVLNDTYYMYSFGRNGYIYNTLNSYSGGSIISSEWGDEAGELFDGVDCYYRIDWTAGNIKIYRSIDGISWGSALFNWNNADITAGGYFGITIGCSMSPYIYLYNVHVNALSSDSTNGVAVSLGGVAHGARYDIAESVKKTLVAGTGIMPGIYQMITRKISTVASASNDYETDNLFNNATDAATVSIETASVSEKATNTTAWTEEREFVRITAADIGDSIEFGVQRRQATNLASAGAPATFVDVMQLIPMYAESGSAPLVGVGDMAFSTTQTPSYVRRVEQKTL